MMKDPEPQTPGQGVSGNGGNWESSTLPPTQGPSAPTHWRHKGG